jgi:hypothetical protein
MIGPDGTVYVLVLTKEDGDPFPLLDQEDLLAV